MSINLIGPPRHAGRLREPDPATVACGLIGGQGGGERRAGIVDRRDNRHPAFQQLDDMIERHGWCGGERLFGLALVDPVLRGGGS